MKSEAFLLPVANLVPTQTATEERRREGDEGEAADVTGTGPPSYMNWISQGLKSNIDLPSTYHRHNICSVPNADVQANMDAVIAEVAASRSEENSLGRVVQPVAVQLPCVPACITPCQAWGFWNEWRRDGGTATLVIG